MKPIAKDRLRSLALIGLSVVYLCFELAFNARLLDVVGTGASPDEVHAIEVYGRTLSGIAVALVVLSILWGRRAKSPDRSPGWMTILLACGLTIGAVYLGIEKLVDTLVERQDAEFRRTSLNILLLQDALVDGKVALEGLNDEPGLFASPQGKAFLALFPAMAISIERLDEKIRPAKLSLIERKLREESGGIRKFYDKYQNGVDEIRTKYNDYRRLPTEAIDVDAEVKKRQEEAWNDYLGTLGARGWTPSTVPAYATKRVVDQVRRKVPVPTSWMPSDEATFRAAVERQTRKKLSNIPGADGVVINGRRIPPGLGWGAFFAHEAVQSQMRAKLELTGSPRLLDHYDSREQFDREVFKPSLSKKAAEALRQYESPLKDYQPGGQHEAAGVDAARAVMVPPIALLFSLVGAAAHFGKILTMLVFLVRAPGSASVWLVRAQGLAIFGLVVGGMLVSLRLMNNSVIDSPLYRYMDGQLRAEGAGLQIAVSNGMHIIAVGQAYFYPLNEKIRTELLGGITYGYQR